MAHFAKLNDNNVVIAVHVVNNDVITVDGAESEQAGIDFLTGLHGHSKWKQTSYNGNFRKNYSGIGFTYDEVRDAFIPPQPFPSWVLDEETCIWHSPIPHPEIDPDNPKYLFWYEKDQQWVEELPIEKPINEEN
jgi:hypothetical protein